MGVEETTADDYLGTLIEDSLLDWDEAERFYRLHDLVREDLANGLVGEQRHEAEGRHARYFCDLLNEANRFDLLRALPNGEAGFAWARARQQDDTARDLFVRYSAVADLRSRVLRPEMEQLSTRDREILTLRYALDYDTDQIAAILAIKTTTVHIRLARARKRLAAQLEDQGLLEWLLPA
jgi:RNA polymerase sigma factor (sigma-70 family)